MSQKLRISLLIFAGALLLILAKRSTRHGPLSAVDDGTESRTGANVERPAASGEAKARFQKLYPGTLADLPEEFHRKAELTATITGYDPRIQMAVDEMKRKRDEAPRPEKTISAERASEIRANVRAALGDPTYRQASRSIPEIIRRVDEAKLDPWTAYVLKDLGTGKYSRELGRLFVASSRTGASDETVDLLRHTYLELLNDPDAAMTAIERAFKAIPSKHYPESREALAQLALQIPGKEAQARVILQAEGLRPE